MAALDNALTVIPESLRGDLAVIPTDYQRALSFVTPEMLAGCTTKEAVLEILQQVAESLKTDDQANYIPAVYTINHKTQRFQDDAGDAIKGPFKAVVIHFQPTRGFFIEGRKLPLCSAIGNLLNGTAPTDAAEAWAKYNLFTGKLLDWAGGTHNCSVCPFNEFGSDPKTGSGKACKEKYRLFLAVVDAEGQLTGEGVLLNVPTTSMKNWDGYVSHLKRHKAPGGKLEPKTTTQVVTLWELEKAQGQGQDYAKVNAKADRMLSLQEFQYVFGIRKQIIKVAEKLGVEAGETYGEEETGTADPAGGSTPHNQDGEVLEEAKAPDGVGF